MAQSDAKKAIAIGDSCARAKDYEMATYWYEMAIEKGGLQANIAQEHLTRMQAQNNTPQSSTQLIQVPDHLKGGEVVTKAPQNSAEAEKAFNKGVTQGNIEAKNPPTVPQPKELTFAELRKKAEKGDVVAQYELGNCYYYGSGIQRDVKEAVVWYRKAAEQGNVNAQCRMGHLYEGAKNYEEAIKWHKKAVAQGNVDAQSFIGGVYMKMENYAEAEKWYRMAYENGNESAAISISVLALNYEKGEGVTKNIEKAISLYTLILNDKNCGKEAIWRIDNLKKEETRKENDRKDTQARQERAEREAAQREKWRKEAEYQQRQRAEAEATSSSSYSSQSTGNYIYRVKYSSAFINMKKEHASWAGQSWNGPYQRDFNTEQEAINHLKEIYNSYANSGSDYGIGSNYNWVGTVEKVSR